MQLSNSRIGYGKKSVYPAYRSATAIPVFGLQGPAVTDGPTDKLDLTERPRVHGPLRTRTGCSAYYGYMLICKSTGHMHHLKKLYRLVFPTVV